MPIDNDRLDAAITAALSGRGRDSLRSVIAGLFQARTAATVRALEQGAADQPRPSVKVVTFSN